MQRGPSAWGEARRACVRAGMFRGRGKADARAGSVHGVSLPAPWERDAGWNWSLSCPLLMAGTHLPSTPPGSGSVPVTSWGDLGPWAGWAVCAARPVFRGAEDSGVRSPLRGGCPCGTTRQAAVCFPSQAGVPRLHVTPSHMFWKLPSEPGLAMTSAHTPPWPRHGTRCPLSLSAGGAQARGLSSLARPDLRGERQLPAPRWIPRGA